MSHPDPTEGPRAKIQRAREHLDALKASYEEWFEVGNPISTVELEQIAGDGTQWLVSRCSRIDRPPPVQWGLIAGDAAHNIRTALDHLAHSLVEAGGGTPTLRTAFPLRREDPFSDRGATRRFEQTIEGMPDAAKQLIVAFQPFRSTAAEVVNLAMVADVDNLDKHRIVLPSFMNFAEEIPLATWAVSPAPDEVEIRINRGVRLEPGVELARARTLSGLSPMGVNIGYELKVTYGDFSPACTLGALRAGAAFVEELITGLDPSRFA